MKPSNTGFNDPSIKTGTGIDWLKEWQECEDVPVLSAMLVYKGDTEKGFIDLCEWAAQVGRKEAKAEWQRELAAKVARMDADTTDPEMIASEFHYKYGWNDAIRTFRVLLNENDEQ